MAILRNENLKVSELQKKSKDIVETLEEAARSTLKVSLQLINVSQAVLLTISN